MAENVNSQDLKNHLWKNRVLIIKTSNPKSSAYQKQVAEFQEAYKDLKERKLVVYHIIDNRYQLFNYEKQKATQKGIISKTTRRLLNENDEFEVILIGLDGGTKLRQNEFLSKEELNRIIDSMPMRINELRREN